MLKKQMKIALLAQGSGVSRETHKLTERLARTYEFRLLAIHNVVTNKGGKTPGVDKEILTNDEGIEEMANKLLRFLNRPNEYKVSPVKRVYIPKIAGGERPLGIPTIQDRCMQSLVKLILEPITEISSDPHSFGFRKGRSAKNALAEVRYSLRTGEQGKYILDADIKKFFDRISHE